MPRILGVDPGSRLTGFGVIDTNGQRLVYVDSGCIRVAGTDLGDRLASLHRELRSVIEACAPAEIAVERVYVHRNADSALKLGQARGVAICAAALDGLTVVDYTPSRIKQAVVGRGGATKQQIQHMVMALLELGARPQTDAADALAVAVCHAHSRQSGERLASAGRRAT